jgi:BirA family biotin operon repressor/biotin-[acetyl-CoA-carboxylase] ligase
MGFAPILVGLAVAKALRDETGLAVELKWPNDVQVAGRKIAGLLSERVDNAVIVGCGINVGVRTSEMNVPDATSLADHGLTRGREEILVSCLVQLSRLLVQWREGSYSPVGSGLLDSYRRACATIGQTVAVQLPGDRQIEGLARDVDDKGRLLVETEDGLQVIDAGDVTHVRPSV